MTAKIIERREKTFTVEVKIPYKKNMMEFEEKIQEAVNEVGVVATKEALEQYDTDGTEIMIGEIKYTSKGKESKRYQTPYGETIIERHVYQSSKGGETYCPMEREARIIVTSTPRFSKIISSKYAEIGSSRVVYDLEENHGRKVARSFIQNISEAVGSVVNAKEESWKYEILEIEENIKAISIGLDGTCMLMCEEGYREAMVGTIAFHDEDGERKHTIYMAATPEYGKEKFYKRLETEILKVKGKYPDVMYIGLADGAKSNWDFLKKYTDIQTLDFWHAAGYLGKAAVVMFKGKVKAKEKQKWMDNACHNLKHTTGTADKLLKVMKQYNDTKKLDERDSEIMQSTITYFSNNKHMMKYPKNVAFNFPIGSGITEAACKVIIKQRLCNSGMKWKEKGASIVLSLRCLNYSTGRWSQFWSKVSQYGLPALN